MACIITSYTQDCTGTGNAGGIKAVYFANPDDVVITYDVDGNIDTMTFATGKSWHKVDVREQDANYVGARTGDFTARTKLFTGTLTFNILKRTAALRTYLLGLEGCICGFLVGWEEATGSNWVMGDKVESRAFFADGTQASSGATFADPNVETVAIQAQMLEPAPALLIDFDIVPAP
jgi:hypothetical protein